MTSAQHSVAGRVARRLLEHAEAVVTAEQFAEIRRDHRVDGLSIRALADRHGVHRRTVRQALESAVPPPRKTPQRIAPRLEPFKTAIDEMLRSDLACD